MRQATYLTASRHGIYYFRQQIPPHIHPKGKRSDVKISLGTRSPKTAFALSRLFSGYGQSLCIAATIRGMTYDEIRAEVRTHFTDLLTKFKAGVSQDGQAKGMRLNGLTNALGLSEGHPVDWAGTIHPDGPDGLLREFSEARGLTSELSQDQRDLLLDEFYKGYRAFLTAALEHNDSFDEFDLEDSKSQPLRTTPPLEDLTTDTMALPYDEVVAQYFTEVTHAGNLAAKTKSEKQDALKLLGEIVPNKSPTKMTKADARKVKDTLLRLPKNRTKAARTRNLSLTDMLKVQDVETIAPRTVNAYISHMQSFGKWAVDNGHADQNVFGGMRVAVSKKASDQVREAFTPEQLRTLFLHLTQNPDNLVKKDEHKWGSLIGMFTGMRLNEVAQLEVGDVKEVEGVWCIDVSEDGDNNKRLKNASSNRRVPVHQTLIDYGFLSFVENQRNNPTSRLFPKLSYSAQNGYGRNIGRWFNEALLPALEMKKPGLVYHSLRHSMVTRLNQSDASEAKVKAIVGHAQSGVTFSVYFKEGYRPAQLKEVIDLFSV